MTDKIIYLTYNNNQYGYIKLTKKYQYKPIILKINNIPSYCYYGNFITKITNFDIFLDYVGNENKDDFNIICNDCKKNNVLYTYYEKETKKLFITIGCPYCECSEDEINCYDILSCDT